MVQRVRSFKKEVFKKTSKEVLEVLVRSRGGGGGSKKEEGRNAWLREETLATPSTRVTHVAKLSSVFLYFLD